MNKTGYICLLVLGFVSIQAQAKSAAEKAVEQSLQAVTVFVDVTQVTRKHSAARKMTRSHQEFAEQGYELVDVSPYIENGDLEGFFVSYKKYGVSSNN
ncbi:MAG: hypothetical protein R3E90_11410 [Marinicella sp.]|nr:hypothetical protein [Xanthomonadales bacterium]